MKTVDEYYAGVARLMDCKSNEMTRTETILCWIAGGLAQIVDELKRMNDARDGDV